MTMLAPKTLSFLYRGALASCNYGCSYCPFAKRHENYAALEKDRQQLARFVDWLENRPATDRLSVFFTPWGEALVHKAYRQAMIQLSHQPQIQKVAIQTNLSCHMAWIKAANTTKIGIWATYHPGETSLEAFLERCAVLRDLAISHSVGMVGKVAFFPDIQKMRQALPAETYLWINAYQPDKTKPAYREDEIAFLTEIDPLFPYNLGSYACLGARCGAGARSLSIAGDGTVQRCHFVKQRLGNLYEEPLDSLMEEAPCPAAQCHCHIGYVYLERLELEALYGEGLLERNYHLTPAQAHFSQKEIPGRA